MPSNPYHTLSLFPGRKYGPNEPSPKEIFTQPVGKTFYGLELEEDWSAFAVYDDFPTPPPEAREGYQNVFHYYSAGINDFMRVQAAAKEQGCPLESMARTLDFGCGTGRFIRKLLAHHPHLKVHGCDLNEDHVRWCLGHLDAAVVQNCIVPHLPYPDRHFDLVTAFSIFTHIDEFELTWLAELARITQPGGLLYLTVLTDATWASIDGDSGYYKYLSSRSDAHYSEPISLELFAKPMPASKEVFKYTARDIYSCDVFLAREYLQKVWGKFVDVIDIIHRGHDYQDVVVARPKI